MDCHEILFSRHALKRMFERAIPPEAVLHVTRRGKTIGEYPHERPYPAFLLLGFWSGRAIHVVLAKDLPNGRCWIVTAYYPDPKHWSEGYTRRKPS